MTDKKDPKPIANFNEISDLIKLMEAHQLHELEIADDDRTIRLVRGTTAASSTEQHSRTETAQTETIEAQATQATGHPIKSPMVGTFYRAATPSATPYVQVGSRVKPGDCLCLLEAMKMMTPLEADQTGTITQILANDGDAVEYDQILFLIDRTS